METTTTTQINYVGLILSRTTEHVFFLRQCAETTFLLCGFLLQKYHAHVDILCGMGFTAVGQACMKSVSYPFFHYAALILLERGAREILKEGIGGCNALVLAKDIINILEPCIISGLQSQSDLNE
jgi:hypothetical protein